MSRPSLSARATYGFKVLGRASGVLMARLHPRAADTSRATLPFNGMFDTAVLPALEGERAALEQFDLYLFDVMNAPRLRGQIVFEYGTLLRSTDAFTVKVPQFVFDAAPGCQMGYPGCGDRVGFIAPVIGDTDQPCDPAHIAPRPCQRAGFKARPQRPGTRAFFWAAPWGRHRKSTKPHVRPLAPRLSGVLLLQHLRTSQLVTSAAARAAPHRKVEKLVVHGDLTHLGFPPFERLREIV